MQVGQLSETTCVFTANLDLDIIFVGGFFYWLKNQLNLKDAGTISMNSYRYDRIGSQKETTRTFVL
jgi:hypothetical protein